MNRFVTRLFFLCVAPFCISAAPVTTVYYGAKWVDALCPDYSEEERGAFLLGTLFPDIRYMKVSLPEIVYPQILTKESILERSPFEAGRLFHEYFRLIKEETAENLDLHGALAETVTAENLDVLLMLLEDQVYFDAIDKERLRVYLDGVPEDEKNTGLPLYLLQRWHGILSQYFYWSPSSILLRFRMIGTGISFFNVSKSSVSEWSSNFSDLLASCAVQEYLAALEERIESDSLLIDASE